MYNVNTFFYALFTNRLVSTTCPKTHIPFKRTRRLKFERKPLDDNYVIDFVFTPSDAFSQWDTSLFVNIAQRFEHFVEYVFAGG